MVQETIRLINGKLFEIPEYCNMHISQVEIYNDTYVNDSKFYNNNFSSIHSGITINCLILQEKYKDESLGIYKTRYYPLEHIIAIGDNIIGCP